MTKTGKKVLSILNCEKSSLSVVLVRGRTIQKLNKAYRKKDYRTDVLSFNSPSKIAESSGYIGEVIISVDAVKGDKNELVLLLVHGILHLLGYDHEGKTSKKKAEKMFGVQNKILGEVLSR